ncbi:MAG: hypothetical protein HC831_20475 [Chloroflexia bacterium]|nr:hypothetical protein [Chloroflexia bacterium]
MKHLFFLLLLLLVSYKLPAGNEMDSLLIKLEQTMLKREKFDAEKELRINNLKGLLKNQLNSPEEVFYIYNQVIKEYEAYNFDSTMHYIEQNLLLCEKIENEKAKYLNQTRLNLADLLAASGRYKEAVDILNYIKKSELPNELWPDYYMHYRSVYQELKNYSSLKENTLKYNYLYSAYTDSLLTILDHESLLYLELMEVRLREGGQLLEAKKINNQRLEKAQINTRTYSMITYERALLYEIEKIPNFKKSTLLFLQYLISKHQ